MADKAKTVLMTAGYGNQARQIIPKLAEAGMKVRAMRRSNPPGPGPQELGASEVIIGDANNPDDALRAMEGVHTVYHIGPTFHLHERDMAVNMIDQAKRAGVEHFIFSSVLHPILFGLPHHAIKREIEEYLLLSNLNFTILRPADFMQTTVLGVVPDQNMYVTPYVNDHPEALVALEDVAEVAAKVVKEGPVHYGATYELTDGQNPTGTDLLKGLEEAFGRPFEKMVMKPETFHRPEIYGDAEGEQLQYQMSLIKTVLDWYDHNPFVGNGNVLAMLLGRRPTTWVQFLRNYFNLPG